MWRIISSSSGTSSHFHPAGNHMLDHHRRGLNFSRLFVLISFFAHTISVLAAEY